MQQQIRDSVPGADPGGRYCGVGEEPSQGAQGVGRFSLCREVDWRGKCKHVVFFVRFANFAFDSEVFGEYFWCLKVCPFFCIFFVERFELEKYSYLQQSAVFCWSENLYLFTNLLCSAKYLWHISRMYMQ